MAKHSFILILWAGVAIGGTLIAAPAKFQVETLGVDQLLLVGRVQFAWVGMAEFVLLCALVIACIFGRCFRPFWGVWAAIAIFALQQGILRPMLEARSDIIVAGGSVPDSNLHIVYIVAEVAKVMALLWSVCKGGPRER